MSKSRGAEDQVFEDFQGERIELNMRKNIQQRLSEPQCQPILSSSTPSQNLLKEDSAGSPMVSCIFSHQCVEAGRLLVHLENALSNSAVGSLKYGAVRTHTDTRIYIHYYIILLSILLCAAGLYSILLHYIFEFNFHRNANTCACIQMDASRAHTGICIHVRDAIKSTNNKVTHPISAYCIYNMHI